MSIIVYIAVGVLFGRVAVWWAGKGVSSRARAPASVPTWATFVAFALLPDLDILTSRLGWEVSFLRGRDLHDWPLAVGVGVVYGVWSWVLKLRWARTSVGLGLLAGLAVGSHVLLERALAGVMLAWNWQSAVAMAGLVLVLLPRWWVVGALVLTVLTQVGGVVWVVARPLCCSLRDQWSRGGFGRRGSERVQAAVLALLPFLVLYGAATVWAVPQLAERYGRVPLACGGDDLYGPATVATCALNRHYVRPELRGLLEQAAEALDAQHPGTRLQYLDAGLPFLDGFPLLPHLSHSDGRKLDLAFLYEGVQDGEPVSQVPSPVGYWVYVQPREQDSRPCEDQSAPLRWDFDSAQSWFVDLQLDESRTRALVDWFARQQTVEKILLELHLESRLGLSSDKVRFQGCGAARHDDHFHVQI